MEKTRKFYHYSIGLRIIFGIMYAVILLRLFSPFEYPSQKKLQDFLITLQFPVLFSFLLSTSISIALKCILSDLESTLANLIVSVEDLRKKNK